VQDGYLGHGAATIPSAPVVNRRPQLEIVAPAADPAEAAAIMAALERFMRDTAPTPAPTAEPLSGWIRAARLEAVDHSPPGAHPWLDLGPLP
jgi:hypothetical protein